MTEIREPQLGFQIGISDVYVHAKPFLKWAGGKQKLLSQFAPHFPDSVSRYFEPFLGGGAVFFHLQPSVAILGDFNGALIEAYRIVKENVEELIASLKEHQNDKSYYYNIRGKDPSSMNPVERASRFIFLNRTCYNGLYRVNNKGQFNVPFGRYKNPTICDEDRLRAAGLALQNVQLVAGDFEETLSSAQEGDLVYLDPPYDPISDTSSFTSYTRDGFGEDEQKRLSHVFRDLNGRGCQVMLSNSDTPLVRELYGGFEFVEVQARRAINSDPKGRGLITELLVLNFE